MNIFVVDQNPAICAEYLDDKRLVKMVLETAQLLSSAIWLNGGIGPYKLTHKGHPCTIWASRNKANYTWLFIYFKELCKEYTKRYNKVHSCEGLTSSFTTGVGYLPDGDRTPWPNCTTYDSNDIFNNYKSYLKDKWSADKRPPRWYKTGKQELSASV